MAESEAIEQGLLETYQKVLSSLSKVVDEHIHSKEFSSRQHGLDFLDTKNSLLLSYLIDLTLHLRNRLAGIRDEENWRRLMEMRTVLDKMRNLDKRLRYQIDKLLALESNASSFAAGAGGIHDNNNNNNNNNNHNQEEDPLQFRPSVDAMEEKSDDDDNEDDDDSSSLDDGDGDNRGPNDEANDNDDDDDDLALARQTLRMAASPKETKQEKEDPDASLGGGGGGVYRAPRMAAVPYTHDQEDRQAEQEKRQRMRMRASELAQALRSQYGDAPEQQDVHGGSELGRQREAARRMAQREAEKTQFEEDQMVRLTTTRKEKKERRRLMRAEKSNLAAIADLGNLVRDAAFGGGGDDNDNDDDDGTGDERGFVTSGRHASGKRKRQAIDSDGRAIMHKGKKRSIQSKNALQAALFEGGGGGGGGKSKKKKNKKR